MKRTVIVNAILAGIVLVISFISSEGKGNELAIGMGIGFLLIAFINLFIGGVLLLASIAVPKGPVKHYATSMLLVAGISLLCSFTFCSTTSFSM